MTTLMNIIMNLFRLLEDSITFPLNIFDNSYYTNYGFDSVAEMLIIRKEIKKRGILPGEPEDAPLNIFMIFIHILLSRYLPCTALAFSFVFVHQTVSSLHTCNDLSGIAALKFTNTDAGTYLIGFFQLFRDFAEP